MQRGVARWYIGLALVAVTLVACSVDSAPEVMVAPPTPVEGVPAEPTVAPLSTPSPPSPGRPTASPSPAPAPSGLVLVANAGDGTVTVLDGATNQRRRTVHIGVPARTMALAPDGRTVWVFTGRRNESDIFFVDLVRLARVGGKRLRDEPSGVAFSSDGSRAVVPLARGSSVVVLDAAGSEIGQVLLGQETPGVHVRRRPVAAASVRGPNGEVLYVAGHGSGVVWALDAGSGRLLAEVGVGGGPIALLPDPSGRAVHVLAQTIDQLVTVDAATQGIVRRLALPGHPESGAISAGGLVAVAGSRSDDVWLVEPSSGGMTRVPVGSRPSGVAFSADGGRLYVANHGDGTVSVVDVPTRSVLATVETGEGPSAVAFAPPPPGGPTPTATPTTVTPTPTPTIVPTPTAIPAGVAPPERLPPNTVRETFVPGAEFPVAMAFAPDGRLFYAELRTGRIRIVENGVVRSEPFYDFAVSGQPEAGLLGLALDPNFGENHHVYALYTAVADGGTSDGGPNGPNHVVRLTDVNGRGEDLTPILTGLPSGQIHNAGSLRFGPDGKLYITLGETGSMDLAQDLRSPAGKILRVNPDGSIPPDNPFAGQPDRFGAIWAYGFRNPFDLDFHPESGALIAGESGPGDNDELNVVVEGGNYGWPPSGFQDKPDRIDPIAVVDPVTSPVGVTFYRGDAIPEWRDSFFYCNFHQGQLRRVRLAPVSFDRVVAEELVTTGCTLDVTTGPDGALYYSDVNAIYRIRRVDAEVLPAVAAPAAGVEGTPTPTSGHGLREQDRDLNVNLVEWRIEPSRDTVPAGRVRLLVENLGRTVHALRVEGEGVDVSTGNFGPGESRLLEVDLAPGAYRLTCPVGNHTDLGMTATLTVAEP